MFVNVFIFPGQIPCFLYSLVRRWECWLQSNLCLCSLLLLLFFLCPFAMTKFWVIPKLFIPVFVFPDPGLTQFLLLSLPESPITPIAELTWLCIPNDAQLWLHPIVIDWVSTQLLSKELIVWYEDIFPNSFRHRGALQTWAVSYAIPGSKWVQVAFKENHAKYHTWGNPAAFRIRDWLNRRLLVYKLLGRSFILGQIFLPSCRSWRRR